MIPGGHRRPALVPRASAGTSGEVLRALRFLSAEAPLELRVEGGCMRPLLRPGARVQVERARLYLPGDVVAYRAADRRLLVHRVIGYRPGLTPRLITQADRAEGTDPPVPLDQVIGRVCGGDCDSEITRVPLRCRLAALGRFARAACRHLVATSLRWRRRGETADLRGGAR